MQADRVIRRSPLFLRNLDYGFGPFSMADDGEQRPQGAPDYKVYRSKRGIFSRLKGGDVPKSGDDEALAPPHDEPGRTNYGGGGGRERPHMPDFKLPWKSRERRARGSRNKPPARRIAFWL